MRIFSRWVSLGAVMLVGCASPAPTRAPELALASPLDADGGISRSPGAVQRIDRASIARSTWRALRATADADETVSLPDLMRWLSNSTGHTILVDPSAAHERVWLGSSVFCDLSLDD